MLSRVIDVKTRANVSPQVLDLFAFLGPHAIVELLERIGCFGFSKVRKDGMRDEGCCGKKGGRKLIERRHRWKVKEGSEGVSQSQKCFLTVCSQ